MEIRARYTLIGLFTLLVIAAAFAFVYWLNNAGGLSSRAQYRVRYENTVSGLLKGSAVLFNGIRVGEVSGLQLSAENPKQVVAVFAVDRATPVRADTKAGIEFQGLMGAPVVSLRGGAASSPLLISSDGAPPMLIADPDAGQNMTEAARAVLKNIDSVVSDNSEPLKGLIANINTFSAVLAKNTDRIDGILGGIERMTGGAKKSSAHVYDLVTPAAFPKLAKLPAGQLVVPEPEILGNLFNDEIVVKGPGGERMTTFAGKWPDTLSRVLQSRVIQGFENAGYLNALGRQPEGLKIDYQLLIDVRNFQVMTAAEPHADIEFSAKIVADTGQILGAKIFKASVPARIADEAAIAASLNEAFAKAVTELVVWTCASL
ncbi:MAG: MCE family protein [Hyphomicrobium sp.]|nr:MCE family protein [Hyphomicrobium sp.]